jgi:cytochrome P450
MAAVAVSEKAAEVDALLAVAEQLGPSLEQLQGHEAANPLFARLVAAWADQPGPTAARGVAGDVALIHVASMSNLFAALGWALVDLFAHPFEASRVAAGDRATAEACALESIRVAQRSIMVRYAMAPFNFDVGDAVFEVPPGTTVATLLPLTNLSSAPGLAQWDPTRWKGRRLADSSTLAAVELVTAFGHGRHTCPAQPFSLAAMTTTLIRLLSNFEWAPGWTDRPLPVRAQIGGVARAAGPCPLTYRRVDGSGSQSGMTAGN